ncbi:hypothetical protein ACFPDQ_04280 [Pseudofrancisella aestuarii]|uniref:CopG family transcriptional regulator n=1 Tax=Pseudofrancisella aestuarii TaxID=2670347 RepID=A0ABV9TBU8_9GAMM|nr:hypothetical protein [Pseudofrancisella aestuarii]
MPLITGKNKEEKIPLRIRLRESVFDEVTAYMKWAKIKYKDHFIEEACRYVLSLDKNWQKYKKENYEENLSNKVETVTDLEHKMIADDEGMINLSKDENIGNKLQKK